MQIGEEISVYIPINRKSLFGALQKYNAKIKEVSDTEVTVVLMRDNKNTIIETKQPNGALDNKAN